jgi:peptide/nickel transport system substrate-binding protein
MVPQTLPRDLFQERLWADDDEVHFWGWGIGNFLFNPGSVVPLSEGQNWARGCGQVYAGEDGYCTEEWLSLHELWDEIKVAVDLTERDNLIKELTTLWAQNIWAIGTVGEVPQPVVVNNRLKNVPETRLWGTAVEAPRTATQEQFFIVTG